MDGILKLWELLFKHAPGVAIALFAFGIWQLFLKDLFQRIFKAPAASVSDAQNINMVTGVGVKKAEDASFHKLMTVTHCAWREGKLDHLSKKFKKESIVNSLAEHIELYEKSKEEIVASAGIRPFDEDEYMVSFQKNNFLMTSKAIYILKGKLELIMLEDISQYDTKIGWTATIFITLKNGQQLEFSKMDYVPEKNAVKAFIGC